MSKEPKLNKVRRLDSVPLEKVEYTPEGFLIDTPIVTSVGIFEYHDLDGNVHRELRLPEHVFNEKSLETYEGKAVIITHDAGRVSKENVTEEIVGTILSKGYQDENDVRCKIIIHDIDQVKKSGLRELSLGYDLILDETPGEWNGEPYDAIQTEIVINHLAIVNEARAGEQARLNIDAKQKQSDLQKGANKMAKQKNRNAAKRQDMKKSIAAYDARRKRRLDEADEAEKENEDEDTENSDEESQVAEEAKESSPSDTESIEERISMVKDRRDRRDAEGDPEDPETAKGVIAQQDEDIDKLLEIVEELQATADIATAENSDSDEDTENSDEDDEEKSINADSVDAIIAERLKLGRLGDRLNIDGLESLKPMEAKKRVIKAIKPELKLDGKGNHYIKTAFDIAVQELDNRKDTLYQRKQMFNADSAGFQSGSKSKSQEARDKMLSRMQNGGK